MFSASTLWPGVLLRENYARVPELPGRPEKDSDSASHISWSSFQNPLTDCNRSIPAFYE